MNKASISIFHNKSPEEEEIISQPQVPDEVFQAVKRVIESKGCEFIKTGQGVYVVKYSETGPYKDPISQEWLPVYVAKLLKWSSGGIKLSEMENWKNGNTK